MQHCCSGTVLGREVVAALAAASAEPKSGVWHKRLYNLLFRRLRHRLHADPRELFVRLQ